MNCDIKSQTIEELQAEFQAWGQPTYRVSQLLEWLYVHRVTAWDAMTNLPKVLRDRLVQHYTLQALRLVRYQGSRDSTQKFLWQLNDGAMIESVLIPANPALYGEPSDRHTLCVSTQVGCAYGCKFCASGLDGWKRNLGVAEIIEQVVAVERWHCDKSLKSKGQRPKADGQAPSSKLQAPNANPETPESPVADYELRVTDYASRITDHGSRITPSRLINNLVIMGMGEPLANYDNLIKALKILNAPWGGGIGARKMTISTSGLAPQIRKLAEEPIQCRLAVSLHGATDEVRNKIMPVNRKFPLRELMAAGEFYQTRIGRLITFEYILIAGVNDGLEQVKPLAEMAQRLNAKVNLIPYNKVEGLPWERPSESTQEKFLSELVRLRVTATLRREKGGDIDAACGQLRLRTERELRVASP